MSGPLHHMARWMRLALACLALVGASASAHTLPTATAVVSVLVEQYAPERPRTEVRAPVHREPESQREVRLDSRPLSTGGIRETRAPGPPRRLFLTHRALLH
ncbi:MAG TPA: hypothetical protein VFZ09_39565 [Archangium sp.]|uniref:hypothetical protein n=1 Tax=Archangium sp. TaxID=1872627 RepID=UPI002E315ACD|nr:hypothetical protein [Archangium sp.]HEX5752371.1 hypothetical protein [Archangium sp.]